MTVEQELEELLGIGLSAESCQEVKAILSELPSADARAHLTAELRAVLQADLRKIAELLGRSEALKFGKSVTPSQVRIYAGLAAYRLGNLRDAISNYEKAVELNPKDRMARFNLGQAQYTLGTKMYDQGDRRESFRLLHSARRNLNDSCSTYESPLPADIAPFLKTIDECLADECEESLPNSESTHDALMREYEKARRVPGHTSILILRDVVRKAQAAADDMVESLARARLSSIILMVDHDISLATDEAAKAMELANRIRDPECIMTATGAQALVHLAKGQVRESMRLNEVALSIATRLHDKESQGYFLHALANNYRALGDDRRARQLDDQAGRL